MLKLTTHDILRGNVCKCQLDVLLYEKGIGELLVSGSDFIVGRSRGGLCAELASLSGCDIR